QPRRRAPGAGPKFAHDLRDRLLLALFWLRTYPTFELLGFFFALDKTSAEDNLKDMLATLESMTDFTLERPRKDRKNLHTVQEVLNAFPELAVLIDAKEQRVQRPTDNVIGKAETGNVIGKAETGNVTGKNEAQKPYYSGKKKCHTLKNQVTVTPEGMIQAVSDSVPGGANHDLTLLRDSHLLDQLQDDEAAMMDKGYVGIRNDYPNKRLYLPFKASRGHPLTEEQKAYNRHLSHYRIVIEHTMSQLNVFQVLGQVYRHVRNGHTQVVRIVAGLVNRRIKRCPLKSYGASAQTAGMAA
ncbi:MAG: transposase family protein, partial [Armatimonadota bacterium]|nr:transposase family protein [Armatimonadota bacterium]